MSSIPAQGGRSGQEARNHALVGADASLAVQMRAIVADADAALAGRFDRGDDIDALLRARAVAIDAQVQAAWKHCIASDAPLALFAVGGYGRGELFPQSDIDLLVLAEADAQAAQHDALARFFALLWDAGLPVGHAVRSAAECTEAARSDITVLTALSESTRAAYGRRASTSSPSAKSSARATRALAIPPTTSNPTSRKAPAVCATCRRCAGWRCACRARATWRS
jgi:[protein-PII] uridylyltransferase